MTMLELYRNRMALQGSTVGQALKRQSDMIAEESWWNDIGAKKAYIYDAFHDDQPMLNQGMTYEQTTKTPIDVKFITTNRQSLDKDQISYHLQFKPSEKLRFDESDDMYYYETDYKQRYFSEYPIGLFVDLPDDQGVYRKWLICGKDIANQFVKYLILPCDYHLHWIEDNGGVRYKRKMWCVLRNQNSYNSGYY